MKKAMSVSLILILSGLLVMFAGTRLFGGIQSTDPEELNTYSFSSGIDELFIEIGASDICLLQHDGETIEIQTCTSKQRPFVFDIGEKGLRITQTDLRPWHMRFGISFGAPLSPFEITVSIPHNFNGRITVKTDSGNIHLSNTELNSEATLSSSSGNIHLTGLTVSAPLRADTSSGDLMLRVITSTATVALTTSSGEINTQELLTPALTAISSSGDLSFSLLNAEKLGLQSSSGDISVTQSKIADAQVRASSGDISIHQTTVSVGLDASANSGNIICSFDNTESEVRGSVDTGSGDTNRPASFGGGNIPFRFMTSSGDIILAFGS